MNKRLRYIILLLIMQPFVGSVSLSQNLMSSSSFFTTTCNVGSEEVLITVFGDEDDLTLKVTNLETLDDSTYVINEDTNQRAPECDWVASSEAGIADGYGMYSDTPYKFEFITGGITRYTLLYLQCTDDIDRTEYSFYCPVISGGSDENDLYINFNVGTNEIDVLPVDFFDSDSTDPVSVNDYFSDDNWLMPYNQYLLNPSTTSTLDYFVAAQIPASFQTGPFTLTEQDLTIWGSPIRFTWDFDDMELRFQSGTNFVVEGTFTTEDTKFTATGSNWDGFDFKDGSEATLTNVDILKVGAGAYTGSFTVRDGADVTVLTDSDNIVLGPNFKAELGSEFLASYVSGGSSAFPGPVPELAEDIEQTTRKETQASGEEMSITVESYPNPFNPSTTIRYRLETDSHVVLKIYNLLGQEVKTLVFEFQSVGSWESIWDGRNNSGSLVPSGAYIYRLEANGQTQTGQLVLVK